MRPSYGLCAFWLLLAGAAASVVHYNISTVYWDWEFKKNKWAFIDKVAVERGRNSLITNIFYSLYGGGAPPMHSAPGAAPFKIHKLLDVGCGEAVLSDFLTGPQKPHYHGIDISVEAIKNARKRRASNFDPANPTSLNPENLQVAGALEFMPPAGTTFGAIVFNEMLYYTDYTQVLQHYIPFLEPPSGATPQGGPAAGQEGGVAGGHGGVIIISCWYTMTNAAMKDGIFKEANRLLESIDSMELSGYSVELKAKKGTAQRKVWFHIEALRVRR